MRQHAIWKVFVLAGALLAPCLGFSAETGVISQSQSDNGIAYMSGGVGLDEREAMHSLATNYNLRLVFAAKEGAYLSDVKVDIRDTAGRNILSAVSNGPWFFAKLPNGRYRIMVEAGGKNMTRSAVVGSQRQTALKFYWPD